VKVASDLARFDDAGFDLVFSSIVLHHVPDRLTIKSDIAEFCRVTRPAALVMFQLPSHIPAIYRTQWRGLYAGLRRLGVGARFLYGGCGWYRSQ
jgi:ubiquinone/menaquinone biosynthesis C-methylase UbiE